jgi:acetyltransferase-like isoleucine patch superfamily enzyme
MTMLKSIYTFLVERFPALGRLTRRLWSGGSSSRVRQHIQGQGNLFQAEGATLSHLELDIIGDRNRIQVGAGSVLNNLRIRMRGSDHRIEIGRNCRVSRGGLFWFEDDACELEIGQNTTMVEVSIAVTEPHSRVVIGEECMFANDVDIRTGDSHSVLEAGSGRRINFAENVTIGRHVWVAAHTIILKGVAIGEDSVVAAGAVVTRSCEPGVILAGNPAQPIKTGIRWKRERISKSE